MQGTQVPFEDEFIAKLTDWDKVRKAYKLNAATSSGIRGDGKSEKGAVNGEKDGVGENEEKELEIQILGAMALKGAS